jgi:hypothetical protein
LKGIEYKQKRHGNVGGGQMKCEGCGTEFIPNRSWQKFHDTECQQRWHYAQRVATKVAVELKMNGNAQQHTDAYRDKWATIRAEWIEEDRQEKQRKAWRRM